MNMIRPESISKGDKIAIISPASGVKGEFIDGAAEFLSAKGYEPVIMPHAKGANHGTYAATQGSRLSDFLAAWEDNSIRAVICGRGGYGATHLLPHIPDKLMTEHPKWLVGFSDISALHAISLSQGVMSIHGPMCRHFKPDDKEAETILEIMTSDKSLKYIIARSESDYHLPPNREGEASGMLIGGNVAVLNGLAATPFDMFAMTKQKDCILFIEDIAEPIYKIERVLYRLLMQGVFRNLKGLIIGRFTEYTPSKDFHSMEEMIQRFLMVNNLHDFPVAYGFPCGHIDNNFPLIEGAQTVMKVEEGLISLNML